MYTSTTKDDMSNMKNAANGMKNDLTATAHEAGHKVRDFIDSASEDLTQATKRVTSQMQEKPVQSSLIALGIGFVLGALLLRR